jgi:hypothetical protein
MIDKTMFIEPISKFDIFKITAAICLAVASFAGCAEWRWNTGDIEPPVTASVLALEPTPKAG